MTESKRESTMSSAELLASTAQDGEPRSAATDLDDAMAEEELAEKREQEPLSKELESVGVHIETAWELVNTDANYSNALPILLRHLDRPYSDATLEGIARAMAVPASEQYWTDLREKFLSDRAAAMPRYKEGLAVALSSATGPQHTKELICMLLDEQNGPARFYLLLAVKRLKSAIPAEAMSSVMADKAMKRAFLSISKMR